MPAHKKDNWFQRMLDSNPKRSVFLLFLLSLSVRLVFAVVFSDRLVGDWMDSVRYLRVAANINGGRGFSEYNGIPTAFVPPIYPYFLAGLFRLFGPHPLAVQLFQALPGALVCLAVYRMGFILIGHRAGILAMAITALYPELWVMTGFLYTETLFMLFLCWSFVLLLRGMSDQGTIRDWIVGGVLFGLGMLTRNILFFFPVLMGLLFIIIKKYRIHFKKLVLFSAVAYALLVPWTIRNYKVFHAFIPVATGGGGEFWIGTYIPFEGEYHYEESRNQIQQLTKGAKNEVDKDRILIRAGLENIRRRPVSYFRIFIKKWFRFFFQVYENIPAGKPRSLNMPFVIVLSLLYYPILFLAVASLFFIGGKWISFLPVYGAVIYCSLLFSMVHVVPRYRIPLLPFFILTGVTVLDQLYFKRIQWR